MRTGGNARAAALTAAVVLALGVGAAGCSDDSGGTETPKTQSPAAETTTSAAPEPSDTASASESAGTGEGPADEAAAKAQITKNFEDFFDPEIPVSEKGDLLEDGDKLQPLMQQFSGSEQAKGVSVKVTEVTFSSPTQANVVYAMAVNGATVLPNAQGVAVLDGKTWKVSKATLCGLVNLSGTPGPGCS